MAVRYDQKTKDEVIDFIVKYNEANKRGGQSAAAEKYKISPITIGNWLKKAGLKKGGKAKTKTKGRAKAKASAGKSAGRPKKEATTAGSSSVVNVLQRMASIQGEIEALQAEYDSLKGKL